MEMERDRHDERVDRYDDSPARERREGSEYYDDDLEAEKPSKHRSSKDRKKSSSRGGEDKDHHRSRDRDRDRERSKRTADEYDISKERDKRKDDRDENDKGKDRSKEKLREKDYDRDKHREKDREREKERDRDKERKDRGKEKEREKDREADRERVKEKNRDRDKDREKEKEREKYKDREKEREVDRDRDRDREKGRERTRDKEKEREADPQDKDRSRDKANKRNYEVEENVMTRPETDHEDNIIDKENRVSHYNEDDLNVAYGSSGATQQATSEIQERILRMKEERLKKSDDVSEIMSWVNKSRKLEERKKAEKQKALQLSKIFEEQDNIGQEDSEDEEAAQPSAHNLSGVKVLHGLDKVAEGGAVVLTLKDQSILADGDINEDIDMLENVEIGEQKRRDEAYKAAKKKTGIYDDKFNDIPGSERKILPQYDDPVADEGVTLDERGRVNAEAEKKLEELRKRLQGSSTNNHVEDLTSSMKITSDYYTQEEMLKFRKPKKKKALRKKDKLDIDALEAEAVASGLGVGDLVSRSDSARQAMKEQQERAEAEKRTNAYQSAYAKAEEASKSLHQQQQDVPAKMDEDENLVIADDDDDQLYKSLERARKLALKKQQEEAASGPQAIARIATSTRNNQTADDQNTTSGEGQDRVVFTEMEEFVWGLQLNEETRKTDTEDVFMEEDEPPRDSDQEMKYETDQRSEVKDSSEDEKAVDENEVVPDETLVEPAVGKGLSGALKLLKERGALKETVEWGGRNMDKKKSKLVGIVDSNNNAEKEIRIERTDEFGRILTPKEAFRLLSHKFHGKGPGKMKQEKRMKQYQEELKLKRMKNSDTPSLSVERMREAQAQLKTPYLVLSGHVKPGQTSDPRSGFATVEKDGGLTPMLGDKKVEHFLGIKRKAEPGNTGTPKKPKT